MRLRTDEPPQSSVASALLGVNELTAGSLAQPDARQRFLIAPRSPEPAQNELTAPHRIYVLTLNDLMEHRGLESARDVGWRYFVTSDSAVVATAETTSNEGADDHQFASLSRDPSGPRAAEIISTIEDRPIGGSNEFELRLLRIPAAYSINLWLHGDTADYLVPIDPTPPSLQAGEMYQPDDVLEVLRSQAAEVDRDDFNGT